MENLPKQRMPARDFIFIDEAGEPSLASNYYALGLIHVTDIALEKINIHLGALRYFGKIKKELKSTSLSPDQKESISEIILSVAGETFVHASAVYVDKSRYEGKYLGKDELPPDGTRFRNHIARELLEFHFSQFSPQSPEIELIFDRIYLSEKQERRLRNYLSNDQPKSLPSFKFIIQADSRYVELLQVADWIAGVVKEKYFTHPERNYREILEFINLKRLTN